MSKRSEALAQNNRDREDAEARVAANEKRKAEAKAAAEKDIKIARMS